MSYKEKVNCTDIRKYNPTINSNNLAKLKIKCQDLYSQFHPGMTAATFCNYKVFHSPKMKVKREPLIKSEKKSIGTKKYWYELSAAE